MITPVLVGEVWCKAGMVNRTTGLAITTGTVNYYLKAKTGTNAGKWFDGSVWQVAETPNTMEHDGDGNWTLEFDTSPFEVTDVYLEYAKESGNLHVAAEGRLLRCVSSIEAVKAVTDKLDDMIEEV